MRMCVRVSGWGAAGQSGVFSDLFMARIGFNRFSPFQWPEFDPLMSDIRPIAGMMDSPNPEHTRVGAPYFLSQWSQ